MTQDQQVPLGPRASARIAACFGSRMLSARCAIVAIAAVVLVAGQLPQAQADKVYFAGWLGSVGGRANPDGSGFEPLVVLSDYGHGLALDPAGGQMYWMSGSLIKGANLDSNRASYFVFENTVD